MSTQDAPKPQGQAFSLNPPPLNPSEPHQHIARVESAQTIGHLGETWALLEETGKYWHKIVDISTQSPQSGALTDLKVFDDNERGLAASSVCGLFDILLDYGLFIQTEKKRLLETTCNEILSVDPNSNVSSVLASSITDQSTHINNLRKQQQLVRKMKEIVLTRNARASAEGEYNKKWFKVHEEFMNMLDHEKKNEVNDRMLKVIEKRENAKKEYQANLENAEKVYQANLEEAMAEIKESLDDEMKAKMDAKIKAVTEEYENIEDECEIKSKTLQDELDGIKDTT